MKKAKSKTLIKSESKSKRKYKVILVDDHPIVRQGLCEAIDREDEFEVACQAASAAEAMTALEGDKYDIGIFDISLKERSGLELLKDMRSQGNNMPVLVLSVHDESTYAERALKAGARGYITKGESAEVIIEGLRTVLAGEIYVSKRMVPKLLNKYLPGRSSPSDENELNSLSDRELEVLEMIGRGVGTRESAKKLSLSVSTVETYRANIKRKLGIASASELARFAAEWRLKQG